MQNIREAASQFGSLSHLMLGAVMIVVGGSTILPAEDTGEDYKAGDDFRRQDAAAVAEVRAETRHTASAAWWGFDETDATPFLQAAINSGARRVVVPNMGKDWIITPITLAANQEIFFEPGVVVTAKRGAFKGSHDSLFKAKGKGEITIGGYGATLRMQKADYMTDAYSKAEWRTAIYFDSCHDIRVYGLTIRDTGGDGVYLGDSGEPGYNRAVKITDVLFENNYRQGISLISAEDVVIHNCVFKDTSGTGPAAGMDLEPNHPAGRLVNITVRNCVADNNQGPGFIVSPSGLSSKSKEVSVLIENCYVKSGRSHGLMVSGIRDDGPGGLIEFRNCHVRNTRLHGARILDKSASGARVRFVNCTWKDVAKDGIDASGYKGVPNVPIVIHLRAPSWSHKPGGVDFVECMVVDEQRRPFIVYRAPFRDAPPLHDVQGNFTVTNPETATTDLGEGAVSSKLRISR
ncbi:MAG: right-handed parallel beta-helix repeat-containing protein [Planctomycetes bacterium]|nr:right-handed parallel beta-helix repeat-containing protein [Planctomycetota bacterium]